MSFSRCERLRKDSRVTWCSGVFMFGGKTMRTECGSVLPKLAQDPHGTQNARSRGSECNRVYNK